MNEFAFSFGQVLITSQLIQYKQPYQTLQVVANAWSGSYDALKLGETIEASPRRPSTKFTLCSNGRRGLHPKNPRRRSSDLIDGWRRKQEYQPTPTSSALTEAQRGRGGDTNLSKRFQRLGGFGANLPSGSQPFEWLGRLEAPSLSLL